MGTAPGERRGQKSLRNFKAVLQYVGTRYQGWQRQQSSQNTIQGKLEAILQKMTGEPVEVHGSGRTDAGVHAYGQVANFKLSTDKDAAELLSYINQYLPEDIAVVCLEEVPLRFHSRLNATGKCYRYRILNSAIPQVFEMPFVWQIPEPLDVDAMRVAAQALCGVHDYRSFTSLGKTKKSTIRRVDEIRIERLENEICFTFQGDGFLYHMIRIIMGTLVEVGKGERKASSMAELLQAGQRSLAGPLAPARGLALMEVYYDEAGRTEG